MPLSRLFARDSGGRPGRYGALVADDAGILDLPRGFSYRVLQREHQIMSDGYRVPSNFDAMACFAGPKGTLVLMRNHENSWFRPHGPYRPGQKPPKEAYNPRAFGGVTRLVVDAASLEVRSSNLVLAGTVRNCAGGMSPWGWLSCEETINRGHGYVFLCPTGAERVTRPNRILGYGRYRHEAACIDPRTNIGYLTEDQPDGCLYRFVPHQRDRPFEGRLQALRVQGSPRLDTGSELGAGAALGVDWVDVDDPDPVDDIVRFQAHERGAAIIRRGEGIWFFDDGVYICSTSGGPADAGQVFRLSTGANPRLELLAQSRDTNELDMPDNLTVSPWGEVYLAEDAVGGDQYIRGLTRQGEVFDFARNALSSSELAGVCFSPDGKTMFVNIYGDGLTLAIRGPFPSA